MDGTPHNHQSAAALSCMAAILERAIPLPSGGRIR